MDKAWARAWVSARCWVTAAEPPAARALATSMPTSWAMRRDGGLVQALLGHQALVQLDGLALILRAQDHARGRLGIVPEDHGSSLNTKRTSGFLRISSTICGAATLQ